MRVLGIDPGRKGALAVCHDGKITYAAAFPSIGNETDWVWINNRLIEQAPDLVVLEKVHAMPGNGSVSMFTFGDGCGVLRGMLIANHIPFQRVTPQAWSKSILAGENRKETGASIRYVQRAFPTVSLLATPKCRSAHDGIADAVCLAEFGYRHFGRGVA